MVVVVPVVVDVLPVVVVVLPVVDAVVVVPMVPVTDPLVLLDVPDDALLDDELPEPPQAASNPISAKQGKRNRESSGRISILSGRAKFGR